MTNEIKKYVCVSMQSTAQMKYWNYPNGWKILVSYLNDKGFDVYVIDKLTSFGGQKMNYLPANAIDKTGLDIEDTIELIGNCEFFIGTSSGLSWVAWALKKHVVMISGFTHPTFEFTTNCTRIFNPNVCNSCFNDVKVEFEKGDWMACPYHKDTIRQFECTKTITPKMVIEQIEKNYLYPT